MIESKPTRDDLFYNPSSSIAITWGQFMVGIALYVLSYYLIDDAFGESWADVVTASNMVKFIIGLILLPPGLILWQCGIFRLSSHTGYHWIANIIFLLLFCIALFTVGAIYFVQWGIQDWLQWDYNFSSTKLVRLVQGIYLVLTMWLTGITTFHIFVRAILQRDLYTTDAKINLNRPKPSAEQQPLISGDTEMVTAGGPNDDLDAAERSSQDYRPLSKAEREFDDTTNAFFEYVSVFLFFFVYIPLFLWINCLTPSDWHRLYPSLMITKLASTVSPLGDGWNVYFQFTCGYYNTVGEYETETCYARLYYDLLLWYLLIFCVSLFSYITCKSPELRIALRKRVYFGIDFGFFHLISMTIGEIVFWILWLLVMIFTGYYWVHIHIYDEDDSKSMLERWARYIGIMGIMFMSMSLFCTTRIRLWNDCFMVSFEHLIGYHRFLSVLFLLCGYIHLILWIVVLGNMGESDYKPFDPIPWSYHSDNFTPIFMWYIMIFLVPIVYVFGTFYLIRRKYFELFYYLHLFGGLIMIGGILWHASQAWRYIIPPLSLYAIDRMIRLANSSRICKVESLKIALNGSQNSNHIEISKLSFSIGSYNMKYGESMFKNLNFKMGQYVFININNISIYEWHPFTIASGEEENECYLMIQNEGDKISSMTDDGNDINQIGIDNNSSNLQFTSLLYLLANKISENEIGEHNIELHIDGPYGKPFVYAGYERIILIAGGIGITPIHSIFHTILTRSIKYNGFDTQGNMLPFVDLIWVAKDSKMFSIFTNTFRKYEQHNPQSNNKFSVRLFATRQSGNVSVLNDDDPTDEHKRQEYGADDKGEDDTEFNHIVPHTDATMYTYGRPNWPNLLSIINDDQNDPAKTLVFCCGPEGMLIDVEKQAVLKGARFQSEGFLF